MKPAQVGTSDVATAAAGSGPSTSLKEDGGFKAFTKASRL